MTDFVETTISDGVATIRLNRPPMNALNAQVQAEIRAAAETVSRDTAVAATIVYGGPEVFAAGADIKEMASLGYVEMEDGANDLAASFAAVARIPHPTIAAITGYALGGGLELAMCCDFRITADNGKLGQPEILLGIIPGAGGTQRLPRLVGPARAKDLIYSGRFIDATESLTIGLVDKVAPAADVYNQALTWAQTLARGPRVALRAAKAAIDRGLEVDLETGLDIERARFAALFATEDQRIGMESFLREGPGHATFTGR